MKKVFLVLALLLGFSAQLFADDSSNLNRKDLIELVAESLNVNSSELVTELCSKTTHHGFLWLGTTITSVHVYDDSYYVLINSVDAWGNKTSETIFLGTGDDGLQAANSRCLTLSPPA